MEKTYERLVELIDNNLEDFAGLSSLGWFRNKWLKENMHVFKAFHWYAMELRHGHRRDFYSIWMIGNRLRWDSMTTEKGSEYKISNNSFAYVSRLLMLADPSLGGMFKTKGVAEEA